MDDTANFIAGVLAGAISIIIILVLIFSNSFVVPCKDGNITYKVIYDKIYRAEVRIVEPK